MSFGHGKNCAVYARGRNLTGYLRKAALSRTADVAETTVFGLNSKTYIPGQKDSTFSAEGVFDGDANAVDQILKEALEATSESLVAIYPHGDTAVGSAGYAFRSLGTATSAEAPVSDVVSSSAEFQNTADVDRCASLHPLAAETSATDGTTLDQTAGTSAGAAAHLHVTAFSGTSVTVIVQHSTNGSAWSTLLSFTAATAAGTSERVEVSGTVNRYVRASWSGTFSSATFAVAFSRK